MNTDRDLVLELSKSSQLPARLASNPLARELQGEILQLAADEALAVLAFEPPARFAQGEGVLQGGIITALLDFAIAFAAHAKLAGDQRSFATASMHVHFLRPARPARYIARGHIVRAGRRLLFAEAELVPGDATSRGELIASASAVLALLER